MEFYMADGELLCQYPDGSVKPVTDSDTGFIREMVATIREWYPGAYNALSECYSRSVNNVPYFHYLMVRRFLKCNFGNLDHTALDIQRTGKFNFEKVHCPLSRTTVYLPSHGKKSHKVCISETWDSREIRIYPVCTQ